MGYPNSNGVRLSDDLLIEILTRQPPKSFFRSKCVSKSWHSLLSDDYVRNKLPLIISCVFHQSNPTLKNEPNYVSTSEANFQEFNLSFLPFRRNSTLIDCCNGLLLFYSSLTNSFHVCNPTTKKWISLPKPAKRTQLSILTFDPYHSQHIKVVSFTGWLAQGAELELFSSESGKWVERAVHWGIDTDSMSATMRYFDGVLYILAHPKQVVAVDLESMACRVIELPEGVKNECCIGKLGGWLHYSVKDGNQLRVWMLKEREKCEWVLKHCVDVKMGQFRVLAFHPEREVVYLGVTGKLVAYDVCEKRVEEVWELGKEEEKSYLIQVWVFPLTKYVEDCLATVDW